LIGVVPNCDGYMEIWPTAFNTYNILVPNALNMPFLLFGSATRKRLVSLGLYVASRTVGCGYCVSHTCSFALRRGVDPSKISLAFTPDDTFSPSESATIKLAKILASSPSISLTSDVRRSILQLVGPADTEWIVLGIAMMGFLNKFMNAIGVELEISTYQETYKLLGADWTPGVNAQGLDPNVVPSTPPPTGDTFMTYLGVLRHVPSALMLDINWTKGVPSAWPAVGQYLKERTGHDFPILSHLQHARPIKAIATIIRDNLNPQISVIGLTVKISAGIIYAAVIQDKRFAEEIRVVGTKFGIDPEFLNGVELFGRREGEFPAVADGKTRSALYLARAASTTPAEIDADIVSLCRTSGMSGAWIVELITWLSLLQMLHRLSSFYNNI